MRFLSLLLVYCACTALAEPEHRRPVHKKVDPKPLTPLDYERLDHYVGRDLSFSKPAWEGRKTIDLDAQELSKPDQHSQRALTIPQWRKFFFKRKAFTPEQWTAELGEPGKFVTAKNYVQVYLDPLQQAMEEALTPPVEDPEHDSENPSWQSRKFLQNFGDVEWRLNNYGLGKNRFRDDTKAVVLKSFNHVRHWADFYNRKDWKVQEPLLFEDKKPLVLWRGASTGHTNRIRFELVDRWGSDKSGLVDVGFGMLVQHWKEEKRKGKAVIQKDGLSRAEIVAHRYILSVEGNDKDSGLSWKAIANSLVFMVKPTKVSWAMEDKMVGCSPDTARSGAGARRPRAGEGDGLTVPAGRAYDGRTVDPLPVRVWKYDPQELRDTEGKAFISKAWKLFQADGTTPVSELEMMNPTSKKYPKNVQALWFDDDEMQGVQQMAESNGSTDCHYILIKDDFSDLSEKVRYYNEHVDEAKAIIRNMHLFMRRFEDFDREFALENLVLQRYFEKLDFTGGPGEEAVLSPVSPASSSSSEEEEPGTDDTEVQSARERRTKAMETGGGAEAEQSTSPPGIADDPPHQAQGSSPVGADKQTKRDKIGRPPPPSALPAKTPPGKSKWFWSVLFLLSPILLLFVCNLVKGKITNCFYYLSFVCQFCFELCWGRKDGSKPSFNYEYRGVEVEEEETRNNYLYGSRYRGGRGANGPQADAEFGLEVEVEQSIELSSLGGMTVLGVRMDEDEAEPAE